MLNCVIFVILLQVKKNGIQKPFIITGYILKPLGVEKIKIIKNEKSILLPFCNCAFANNSL